MSVSQLPLHLHGTEPNKFGPLGCDYDSSKHHGVHNFGMLNDSNLGGEQQGTGPQLETSLAVGRTPQKSLGAIGPATAQPQRGDVKQMVMNMPSDQKAELLRLLMHQDPNDAERKRLDPKRTPWSTAPELAETAMQPYLGSQESQISVSVIPPRVIGAPDNKRGVEPLQTPQLPAPAQQNVVAGAGLQKVQEASSSAPPKAQTTQDPWAPSSFNQSQASYPRTPPAQLNQYQNHSHYESSMSGGTHHQPPPYQPPSSEMYPPSAYSSNSLQQASTYPSPLYHPPPYQPQATVNTNNFPQDRSPPYRPEEYRPSAADWYGQPPTSNGYDATSVHQAPLAADRFHGQGEQDGSAFHCGPPPSQWPHVPHGHVDASCGNLSYERPPMHQPHPSNAYQGQIDASSGSYLRDRPLSHMPHASDEYHGDIGSFHNDRSYPYPTPTVPGDNCPGAENGIFDPSGCDTPPVSGDGYGPQGFQASRPPHMPRYVPPDKFPNSPSNMDPNSIGRAAGFHSESFAQNAIQTPPVSDAGHYGHHRPPQYHGPMDNSFQNDRPPPPWQQQPAYDAYGQIDARGGHFYGERSLSPVSQTPYGYAQADTNQVDFSGDRQLPYQPHSSAYNGPPPDPDYQRTTLPPPQPMGAGPGAPPVGPPPEAPHSWMHPAGRAAILAAAPPSSAAAPPPPHDQRHSIPHFQDNAMRSHWGQGKSSNASSPKTQMPPSVIQPHHPPPTAPVHGHVDTGLMSPLPVDNVQLGDISEYDYDTYEQFDSTLNLSSDSRGDKTKKGNGLSIGAPKKIDLQAKYSKAVGNNTTLMIRNIPCRISQKHIMDLIDSKGFEGLYDFLYLPSGARPLKQGGSNLGYGFINFPDPADAEKFHSVFHDYRFDGTCSTKLIAIYPAHIQGLENNIRHFRRTAVTLTNRKPFIRSLMLTGRENPSSKEGGSPPPELEFGDHYEQRLGGSDDYAGEVINSMLKELD